VTPGFSARDGQETANLLVIVKRLRKHEGRHRRGFAPVSEPSLMNQLEIWAATPTTVWGFPFEQNGFADDSGSRRNDPSKDRS